jgi:hypothetical protein
MAHWTFDVKFPLGTKFTFGSLTFVTGEDGDLRMLPPGKTTEHTAHSSASSGTQADSDFFDGMYIRTVKLVRGIPVVTTILRPCAGASSSSSSALSSDQGSSEDYPEIGVSTCGSSADISRLIFMVAPNEDQPRHSSSGYPTIGRSEASDSQTPSTGLIRNLNPDFNVVRVQAIIETIQRMAPDGSPLALLAQQGAEAANLVVRAVVPRREPSGGHNDRARRARSEVASSFSPNRRLAGNDAQRRITQNRNVRKYDRDRDDLRNVIEDRRRFQDRTSSPPRRQLVRDVTPTGRSGFRALSGPLKDVQWPAKFKVGHIDQYDGTSNPEKFIQVYQTGIKAAGGDDRVKANFLHTALTGAARSWLINLPEASIQSWNQLCAIFIGNFQGTYERPSTAETLKTIKQRHDESLRNYVKRFCNARNAIPHIQDIEIINTFRDGVSDIKTVEEIAMKKPKTVADLLAVADVCIEASEARARLLESCGKGPARRKDDQEVNTAERGDRKDCRDQGFHGKQSSGQKERRPF